MSRKVEPLSTTLKDIVKILREVNTTEDRAELIDPVLVEIEMILAKLADPIAKIYWEGVDDPDGVALMEYLLANPPTIPRGFA